MTRRRLEGAREGSGGGVCVCVGGGGGGGGDIACPPV